MKHLKKSDKVEPQKMLVRSISLDYDGTIGPLKISRARSKVSRKMLLVLEQIGRFLPVSIITTKDLSFIVPRTSFAYAWAGIGGLEMRIGEKVFRKACLDDKLPRISQSIKYARSHITDSCVNIEEKRDSRGRTVAFCVDWRLTKNLKTTKEEVERVASYSKDLGLILIKFREQPFYDVYPIAPDKGLALQELLNELGVNGGVLYMGDSEMDNSAFRVANVSIGVSHDENTSQALDCDYLVEFKHVLDFLSALLANNLLFSSDFPMIESNINRTQAIE